MVKATVKSASFHAVVSPGATTKPVITIGDAGRKYVPCGIVDEESAELTITFGSSAKTSDFIVDVLETKWDALDEAEKAPRVLIQIKIDNGPESSGRRTQFSPSDGAARRRHSQADSAAVIRLPSKL